MRKRQFLAILVALTAALLVYATRPADPASKRIEYRPGAFFPAALELHGTVERTSAPVVEMGKRTRIRVEYTVGEKAIEAGMAIEIWKHFTSDVEEFQVDDAGAPAFFGAEVTAAGVELATSKYSNAVRRDTPTAFPYRKCARAAVTRGRLEQGDKVMLDLGGPKGVRMQSYEENLFNFRVALVRAEDGKLLGYGGDAYLKVIGGSAERLRVVAPAVAAIGEAFTVAAVPEDRFGSLARDNRGREVRITGGDVGPSPFTYDEDLMHYTARG
ncbi:MAG: hypothetical protein GY953_18625, partial [bacterium]|nr:hypothetical protein [bacterium]